jgi:hypothetical protein
LQRRTNLRSPLDILIDQLILVDETLHRRKDVMSGMSKLDYNFQMLLVILMVIITMIAAGALGAMIGFLFLIG